ncbi:N-formylglutamate deformylase [Marinomonas mediterranea]|uniref:N-formylglutamate deformylase n=1 Tax=Marinomonas mediterranea TaxID=119864 RepID=UPI0023495407|nr:N-formylglutamate deformylase [Marinomonas mediterranea]WCN10731.1 N-formylglutamate deformylase [Marinomonas mediterranea]WCN14787.1 N-formylglutamate deformylase [Marinomonas mediterranea]
MTPNNDQTMTSHNDQTIQKDQQLPLSVPAFEFRQSDTPILVSMPHSGLALTSEVEAGLTEQARKLPDTDWYIPELYDFLETLGVGCIKANYSRYVIDLNRPYDDKPLYQTKTTGLFPDILFEDAPVFEPNKAPNETQKAAYKEQIWKPYHNTIEQELKRLKEKFGYAILFDAHSIAAEVPMLFDGLLPDFNWGTNEGQSCTDLIANVVTQILRPNYTQVLNGRFKGGYITRQFGQPEKGIHAIQLELSQATYLDEEAKKAGRYQLDDNKLPFIKQQLKELIEGCLAVSLNE